MQHKVTLLATTILSTILSACTFVAPSQDDPEYSPYISKVYDYTPAPGQFINTLPTYQSGATSDDMTALADSAIVGKKSGDMVCLGGFGGSITFGFDHQVENREGLCDLRIMGNAYVGSSEPGIVMVSRDDNGNDLPDDVWYEIQGAQHSHDGTIHDYQITYFRPESESPDDMSQYIHWSDNQGGQGWLAQNAYHTQSYFPSWITQDEITLSGTLLASNSTNSGTDESPYWVQSAMGYGYADDVANTDDGSAIDIAWAVDDQGAEANLEGIHFVKIYTGVNQISGAIGESSTEILGAYDLHLLEEQVRGHQIK